MVYTILGRTYLLALFLNRVITSQAFPGAYPIQSYLLLQPSTYSVYHQRSKPYLIFYAFSLGTRDTTFHLLFFFLRSHRRLYRSTIFQGGIFSYSYSISHRFYIVRFYAIHSTYSIGLIFRSNLEAYIQPFLTVPRANSRRYILTVYYS